MEDKIEIAALVLAQEKKVLYVYMCFFLPYRCMKKEWEGEEKKEK